MQLVPSISPRERIMGIGVAGTGKSHALLTIARRCPGNTFHVIDNDLAYERLLATDFPDLSNVIVHNALGGGAEGWELHLSLMADIQRDMSRDDWMIVDSTTPTWGLVQEWFTEKVFAQGIAEYFLAVRQEKEANKAERGKDKKSLGALEGWKDWPVINMEYKRLHNRILNTPGHLYCTAELATISDEDDKDIKNMFGPYGVKPAGQKRMPHLFQTIVMFTKSRVGEYAMTTMKDRGRVEMEDETVTDFGKDYLMRVAKWKPGRIASVD